MNRERGGGGLVAGGVESSRNDKHAQIEDQVFKLKDENLLLKKKLNAQDDITKKLITKVQRLTEDLSKQRLPDEYPTRDTLDARPSKTAGAARRDAKVLEDLEDYQSQIQDLSKANRQLRQKVQYFRSLHEAETRKRGPYDHIPPRVKTGAHKKMHPTLTVKERPRPQPEEPEEMEPPPEQEIPDTHLEENYQLNEEIAEFQKLVAMLRSQLSQSEECRCDVQRQLDLLQEEYQRSQAQNDIDRLALQREITEKTKRQRDLEVKLDNSLSKNQAMNVSYEDAVATVRVLTEELKDERRKLVEAKYLMQQMEDDRQREAELREIIADLRAEKELLEQEMSNVLSSQFSTGRDEGLLSEIERLKKMNADLRETISEHLESEKELHAQISTAEERYTESQLECKSARHRIEELLDELSRLRERLSVFDRYGGIDMNDIEEALTLLRLKKEKGITIEFLLNFEDNGEEKVLLRNLRVEHAECVVELEKYKKLFHLQEKISGDYKLEILELNQKIEAIQNEYELKLEEDSRLLDLRANKISKLEAQLKSMAYGTTKVNGTIVDSAEDYDSIVLAKGQNLIEIHIEGCVFSQSATRFFERAFRSSSEDMKSMTTFVSFEFFEFEIQASPLGIGVKPVYSFSSKYKVFVDDFFLLYMQTQPMSIYLMRADGVEFSEIGSCNVVFKDLMDPRRTERIQYYADIVSSVDNKTILGKLEYSLRARIPMVDAIRAFKERIVALNLTTVHDETENSKRFMSRTNMNELLVRIVRCTGLKGPPNRSPAPYVTFRLYSYDDVSTETIASTHNPLFNFVRLFPMPMNLDVHNYLRSEYLDLFVLDDNPDQDDYIYGVARVPLVQLAEDGSVQGEFEIREEHGVVRGYVSVSMSWERPYTINNKPAIVELEEQLKSICKQPRDSDSDLLLENHRELPTKPVARAGSHGTRAQLASKRSAPSPLLQDGDSSSSCSRQNVRLDRSSAADGSEGGSRHDRRSCSDESIADVRAGNTHSQRCAGNPERSSASLSGSSESGPRLERSMGQNSPSNNNTGGRSVDRRNESHGPESAHSSSENFESSAGSFRLINGASSMPPDQDTASRSDTSYGSSRSRQSMRRKTRRRGPSPGDSKSSLLSEGGQEPRTKRGIQAEGLQKPAASLNELSRNQSEHQRNASTASSRSLSSTGQIRQSTSTSSFQSDSQGSSDGRQRLGRERDQVQRATDYSRRSTEPEQRSLGGSRDSVGPSSGSLASGSGSVARLNPRISDKTDMNSRRSPERLPLDKQPSDEQPLAEQHREGPDATRAAFSNHSRGSNESISSQHSARSSTSAQSHASSQNDFDSQSVGSPASMGPQPASMGPQPASSQGAQSTQSARPIQSAQPAQSAPSAGTLAESDSEASDRGSNVSSQGRRTPKPPPLPTVHESGESGWSIGNLLGQKPAADSQSQASEPSIGGQEEQQFVNRSRDKLGAQRDDSDRSHRHQDQCAFSIELVGLQFDVSDEDVCEIIEEVEQLYASYDFLGYPLESLETPSVTIGDDGFARFDHSNDFDMSLDRSPRERRSLCQMLTSTEPSESRILITVVNEPGPGSENSQSGPQPTQASELGYAELDVRDALEYGRDTYEELLPVTTPDGAFCLGQLRIVLRGCDALRELIGGAD
ncbi:uncharacterized protein BJ171DRAFT_498571 [Polychytrium aggregatum]|uniref:uncharacterized protein n=1 Tax=Polychytrium aggregatum TaxID=110093 RepID=UPI0022FE04E8|nr:uncharacterized protein BJ171DRAFT_498571 [Polychytrium aggregatum]KAI9206067.1 hypothetical protein BJ171DRAFT_498571 [Polychytrium aggregatum]